MYHDKTGFLCATRWMSRWFLSTVNPGVFLDLDLFFAILFAFGGNAVAKVRHSRGITASIRTGFILSLQANIPYINIWHRILVIIFFCRWSNTQRCWAISTHSNDWRVRHAFFNISRNIIGFVIYSMTTLYWSKRSMPFCVTPCVSTLHFSLCLYHE